jgi:hypothetical protein
MEESKKLLFGSQARGLQIRGIWMEPSDGGDIVSPLFPGEAEERGA